MKLEEQEKDRKTLLTSLQKKQRSIQSEISKKRRSADRLNAQIDRLIEIEIEKARKRAEEEARRKAEAKRKAELAKEKTVAAGESKKSTTTKTAPSKVEEYKVDSEDRRLSSVFSTPNSDYRTLCDSGTLWTVSGERFTECTFG